MVSTDKGDVHQTILQKTVLGLGRLGLVPLFCLLPTVTLGAISVWLGCRLPAG